jgi:molecular chaperone GrpE
MSGEAKPTPRVRVSDKRITANKPEAAHGDVASDVAPEEPVASETLAGERNYLDDLMRLQAEFDNYRKRMMREQTEIADRASSRLIERLLVVLDNFDRALAHDSDNNGLQLLQKELVFALESEGLEVIDAEGKPFDPNLHEAVESHEQDDVSEPICTEVYRTGYMLKGKILRPAMVVVARPADQGPTESSPPPSEGE